MRMSSNVLSIFFPKDGKNDVNRYKVDLDKIEIYYWVKEENKTRAFYKELS